MTPVYFRTKTVRRAGAETIIRFYKLRADGTFMSVQPSRSRVAITSTMGSEPRETYPSTKKEFEEQVKAVLQEYYPKEKK